ncbi:anti-sigma B factor RsbW [Bacillus smithii]|uniref:anti-sigma B factor RsbW n=1 Tax=Bacillus smithii TaxID=1479 RepID=UPI0030C9B54D
MGQPFDYIEMKIPAKPEYMGVIRLTLSGIASRMGFMYEAIEDLKIVVSEAILNAIPYAYQEQGKGEMVIGFSLYHDRLELMVAYRGQSFHSSDLKKETFHAEQREGEFFREGGLGLYLIETLMDDVKIHHQEGVSVFMTKYLKREQVERDAKTIST